MHIILLSGGSGKRLWPLSNNIRSKQFLKVLPSPNGGRESMLQRIVRQIKESNLNADLTIATSEIQKDIILSQLGSEINIVTEPQRRDTFPAIAIASEYLIKEKKNDDSEVIIVMPCDTFVEESYFDTIKEMVSFVEQDIADIILLGIHPTCPSSKYGYLIPSSNPHLLDKFTEKPNFKEAQKLIEKGALWNAGVFGFRTSFIRQKIEKYLKTSDFNTFRKRYSDLPKISFDYEVVEKSKSIGVVRYFGEWHDLGTWNSLSKKTGGYNKGNVILHDCINTTVFNDLNIPIVSQSTHDLIIAASADGILVSDKEKSENIKEVVDSIEYTNPRYVETSWGDFKTIDELKNTNNQKVTTKMLSINLGECIYSQCHCTQKIILTIIGGKGLVYIKDKEFKVKCGDTIVVPLNETYSIEAKTKMKIISIEINS